MSEWLLSVGLDVGTTSTQMVVSQLEVQNQASAFAVPEMVISRRQIRYRSPVYFTPLLGEKLVDGEGVRQLLLREFRHAGICREDVDTGAVIITGETSRRENARAVLDALSDLAGDFVVATAGPHLESVLAAKGAGAVDYSENTGKTVLHMDIGGGTANLALIQDGEIMSTTCLDVGGRLIKFDENGRVTYVSPALDGLCAVAVGEKITEDALKRAAKPLVQALEMAAGLCKPTGLLQRLISQEAGSGWVPPEENVVISFSGGVADCIEKVVPWQEFGDLGPTLGQAIRSSCLCAGKYRLGEETIRATVIGAGCHSAQLSGSTVFSRNIDFPLKNLPVLRLTEQEQRLPEEELACRIREGLQRQDVPGIIALPGQQSPNYAAVKALAGAVVRGCGQARCLVAVEADMAKALGQAMALQLPPERGCLCIDSVQLAEGSFLDVGAPVGPAMPVVVKTLVLGS